MNRGDSEWVNDLFAATACDWTPASAHYAGCVLYAPISRNPDASMRCASVLSEAERQRADRFITEDGKSNFEQRRAFRRYCGAVALGSPHLSQVEFRETEKGRPYLPDLPDVRFSFSSCRLGFLAAWSTAHGIGVDLEDQTRNLESAEIAHQLFSEIEAKAVAGAGGLVRLRTFYLLWTLKEAALKSIGEGLPIGLDAFQFELAPNVRVIRAPSDYDPSQFHAHVIEGGGRCAALVIRSL